MIVLLFTILFLVSSTTATWSQDEKPKPVNAPNALPGVEPEMLTPEYWIGLQGDADTVIMTPQEIERFNEKMRSNKLTTSSYEGGLTNPILPIAFHAQLPGDSLKVWLKRDVDELFTPEPLYGSSDFYDGRNVIYDDGMKRDLADKMNLDTVPDTVTRRFGIVINHSSMRRYPTHVPGFTDPMWEMDRFQLTDICLGHPVSILHESSDGDFLYVESSIALGWIAAQDVAIAERITIRALTGTTNFLMAAGDKIPVYGDPSFVSFARYFYFSATMPLIEHNSRGYVVKMPSRAPDGSLVVARGYVKPDADVHIGHFPYTKRNMLTQIFKLLNTPYGYNGQDNKRDCSGMLRVVLRCFGITTSRYIWSEPATRTRIDPKLGTEEKLEKVAEIEPVITVAEGSYHFVLYLGKAHTGDLYFMHQGGWGYDEGDQHYNVNRVSINNVMHSWYHIDNPYFYWTVKTEQ
ncbi:SH3 domain-containing protein [Candidatus Latescibacterota bacterium]